jgi:hypothetical protein
VLGETRGDTLEALGDVLRPDRPDEENQPRLASPRPRPELAERAPGDPAARLSAA